MLDPVFFFLSS